MRKLTALVISLIASYLTATPVGEWFASKYALGAAWLYIGPFSGYLDGLLLSYVFFSSLLFGILTNNIRNGFYAALPVLILNILHPADPQLWLSLILLAAGLGLAWLILLLTRQAGKKIF